MDTFLKATGGILIALILYLILSKQNKDISLLLTVLVCCMVAAVAIGFLQPVFDFIAKLESIADMDKQMLSVIVKAVGIGLLSEIVSLICADSGNASLGKIVQILASCFILWLSIPLFTNLIDLVKEILVAI